MKRMIMACIALALTLGAASVSPAQQMKRGGSGAQLLKGIELTKQQREQLKALREKHGMPKRIEHEDHKDHEDRAKVRADMKQRHEQMVAEIRSILTPAQLEIFEKNVTEVDERMKARQERLKERRQ
ncbi:MAG: hypothetical protein ACT4O1_05945 [Gemmatimonadota bacterium]